MTSPSPEHIDAVARVIDPAAFDVDSIDWLARAVIEGPALDLLSSTDPAVHAALAESLPDEALIREFRRRAAIESQGTALRVMMGVEGTA
jgi:hypothetical protein